MLHNEFLLAAEALFTSSIATFKQIMNAWYISFKGIEHWKFPKNSIFSLLLNGCFEPSRTELGRERNSLCIKNVFLEISGFSIREMSLESTSIGSSKLSGLRDKKKGGRIFDFERAVLWSWNRRLIERINKKCIAIKKIYV